MTSENSPSWDLGRFLQTLSYFKALPLIGSLDGWQQWFADSINTPKRRDKMSGVILVVGATGGVGKRVVRQLLDGGYRVRALVRDAQRARELFGQTVALIEADTTLAQTLTPAVLTNVRSVICCTGTRVQPVEGDTPDRAKYYQGVKFYLPEVVDTPELVEYQGVKNLVQATVQGVGPADEKLIFDFSHPSDDLKEIWGALDDVVMGGVSQSSIRLVENAALFSGHVSTENSGGFASVRSRNFEPPFNLSGYEGVQLRLKGDGQRYKFMLRAETRWDGTAYCDSFDTVDSEWITVRIPFAALLPVFRAKTLADAGPIDTRCLYSFQIMLSKFEYDGALNPKFVPGSFQLQLESIKAYGGPKLTQFVLVSSAGVTRPGRPGLNLAEEPPAVRLNEQLGGLLTWKLRGEDSVRESGLAYTIVRPCALTEEPGGQPLCFEQGDHIRGQVSREDVAQLCLRALEQPNACNTTFEVKAAEGSRVPKAWKELFCSLTPDAPLRG